MPPDLKRDVGTRRCGDAEKGIFMHSGEIFFIGTALQPCSLLPCSLLPSASSQKIMLSRFEGNF
ncbi:MAG: hypothetical protein F6K47_14745 [Symploca sp. SIO2E6]|nr:hypothetical protein [Symploca sp. SIO2E6]